MQTYTAGYGLYGYAVGTLTFTATPDTALETAIALVAAKTGWRRGIHEVWLA